MYLVIDTSLEKAHIALLEEKSLLAHRENSNTRDHAGFVPIAIGEICLEAGIQLADLTGVIVVNGPGSYTGLRVGLSAAKGICFALEKPMYTVSTLQLMASALIRYAQKQGIIFHDKNLFCPMIDARRMEVFTGIYKKNLEEERAPFAFIANENNLKDMIGDSPFIFSGNGVSKLMHLLPSDAIVFPGFCYDPEDIIFLSDMNKSGASISDLAYTEPFYIKDFFNPRVNI
jgi:tRNA threonylcarbamoyladenosine biosynthesis protein TsaB